MKILEYFVGSWELVRYIYTQQGQIHAHGDVSFEPTEHGILLYQERGQYTWGGNTHNFLRRLCYACPHSGHLYILNADGSELHHFNEGRFTGVPISLAHEHICGNDTYACKLQLQNQSAFSIRYDISGPDKASNIISIYQRVR